MEKKSNDIYLPEDVVYQILLQLPAKSLVRLKCVCIRWYNLIQSHDFINDHFHYPRNHTRLFAALRNRFLDQDYYAVFNDESLTVQKLIDSPIQANSDGYYEVRIKEILGPVNGLCFLSCTYSFDSTRTLQALWNPSTTEFREIESTYKSRPRIQPRRTCFGFGATHNDVKLVCIRLYDGILNSGTAIVTLYSLASDRWKCIDSSSNDLLWRSSFRDSMSAIFFNGACYWIASARREFLLVFDMTSECFREVISLPPLNPRTRTSICVRDNSIVLFVSLYGFGGFTRPEKVDLWEMNKEGQWSKLLSFDNFSIFARLNPYPRWFKTNDEIVIKTGKSKFVSYNIKSHETRDLGMEIVDRHILSYKESLTSVRGGTSILSK